jgi:translation initiation factor IF-2
MATILVQNGTLRVGDDVVIGEIYGRVRAMFNERGERVKYAPPSTPVVILGLSGVPKAGDIIEVVKDERTARNIVAERKKRESAAPRPTRILSLEDLYEKIKAGQVKELRLILKTDVQGSIEPIVTSLEKLGDEGLKVKLLHRATGSISESDIMLAVASKAIVIGFNVDIDPAARRMAEVEGVDVRLYQVIYKLIEDVEKALKGLLEPTYKDVVIGHAEVRAIFDISKVGKVAGVYVLDGIIKRDALARISRDGEKVYDGRVASLKRFKEDVTEVRAGFECGVGLEGFQEFVIGDIIELFKKERVD